MSNRQGRTFWDFATESPFTCFWVVFLVCMCASNMFEDAARALMAHDAYAATISAENCGNPQKTTEPEAK